MVNFSGVGTFASRRSPFRRTILLSDEPFGTGPSHRTGSFTPPVGRFLSSPPVTGAHLVRKARSVLPLSCVTGRLSAPGRRRGDHVKSTSRQCMPARESLCTESFSSKGTAVERRPTRVRPPAPPRDSLFPSSPAKRGPITFAFGTRCIFRRGSELSRPSVVVFLSVSSPSHGRPTWARSSVGQSSRLIIDRSWVQVPPGPLLFPFRPRVPPGCLPNPHAPLRHSVTVAP